MTEDQELQKKIESTIEELFKEAQEINIENMEDFIKLSKFSIITSQRLIASIHVIDQIHEQLNQKNEALNERTMQHQQAISDISQVTQALIEKAEVLEQKHEKVAEDSQTALVKASRSWKGTLSVFLSFVLIGLAYGFTKLNENWRIGIIAAVAGVILPYIISSFIKSWKE